MRNKKAFTLIELLVVILILGILLAIAIPAYLSSVRDGRAKTANDNAKAIATAVQSAYVKNGGVSYSGYDLGNTAVLSDIGGSIPTNPCNGTAVAGDYKFTTAAIANGVTIKADNTAGRCDDADLVAVKLGAG